MSNELSRVRAASRRASPALIAGAVVGAALAAAYVAVRVKTAAVERSHPPLGSFIEVDGVRLHYLARGAGPAVVLLHGNGTMADDFQFSGLLDRLAQTHRVIAFDRPGFGYSERPAGSDWTPEAQAQLFHRALQELKIDQPIVVGHSWGTLVALAMALDYPQDVRAIALLGGYYYPSLRVDAFVNALAAVPVIGTLWRHTAAPLLGRLLWPAVTKHLFAPAKVPARFGQLPPWMALRPSQLQATAAENGLMVPAAKRLSQRYGELTMPVALLAGYGDKLISPKKNTRRLHAELANSTLAMPDGAGHMLHYQHSAQIADAITALSDR
jgi:pimeloyl-ACP methyl ester carboxylesterase